MSSPLFFSGFKSSGQTCDCAVAVVSLCEVIAHPLDLNPEKNEGLLEVYLLAGI